MSQSRAPRSLASSARLSGSATHSVPLHIDSSFFLCGNAQTINLYRQMLTVQDESNNNDPCPPMSRWLDKGDDADDSDDDIEMGGTTQTFRCPITRAPFENVHTKWVKLAYPVQHVPQRVFVTQCENSVTRRDLTPSQPCGHSYSKAGIFDMLKNKASVKCPIAGCGSFVTKGDLKVSHTISLSLLK
jgi:hypothetical protein